MALLKSHVIPLQLPGTNRQRAQLIKAQRQYLLKQLNNLRENAKEATDSARSHLSHPLQHGLVR